MVDGKDVMPNVKDVLERMKNFTEVIKIRFYKFLNYDHKIKLV